MTVQGARAIMCAGVLAWITASGCSGRADGSATPAELAQQIVITCASTIEPDGAGFRDLIPDERLLRNVPYDGSEESIVRTDPDPAVDAQRIRDAWQVVLDLLAAEDALAEISLSGEPMMAPPRDRDQEEAYLSFEFSRGKGAFVVTAAEIKGRWYIVDARLEEPASELEF